MKREFRRLCVFCGSSCGSDPVFLNKARELGQILAGKGIGLVYGGGNVGLMGSLADSVLEAGGEVTGVIPKALLDKEVGHLGLTDLRVVGSMHERKQLMADLSDGFIALPGGVGTLEELFEIWTWLQLSFHGKPVGVWNVDGFYDWMLEGVDHLVAKEFLREEHARILLRSDSILDLLTQMESFETPEVAKWVDPSPSPEER